MISTSVAALLSLIFFGRKGVLRLKERARASTEKKKRAGAAMRALPRSNPGLFRPFLVPPFVAARAPLRQRPIPCLSSSNKRKEKTGKRRKKERSEISKFSNAETQKKNHLDPALKTSTITVAFLPTTGGRGSTNCGIEGKDREREGAR